LRSKRKPLVHVDHGAISREVGAKVRQIRENKGTSQKELGEMLGVSFQQIQKYECGKNSISMSRAFQISVALNFSIEDMILELVPSKGNRFKIREECEKTRLTTSSPRLNLPNLLRGEDLPNWLLE
jgi:transcriptional regulator with XRE-family HTH domain